MKRRARSCMRLMNTGEKRCRWMPGEDEMKMEAGSLGTWRRVSKMIVMMRTKMAYPMKGKEGHYLDESCSTRCSGGTPLIEATMGRNNIELPKRWVQKRSTTSMITIRA
jgi:hypothetical protein